MFSLTESERTGSLTPLASSLFGDDRWTEVDDSSKKSKRQLQEWDVRSYLRGGLPGIPGVLREAENSTWSIAMSTYVDSVIPLGVVSPRTDHARLLRCFRYLAANPAQLLNMTRMASELQYQTETVRNYVDALEASFLTMRIEAHRPTEHKVLTAHPKLHVTDIGLATWAGQLIDKQLPAAALGGLLENQLAHAFGATLDWTTDNIVLRHWRDQRAKQEVDLLLVHPDGRCLPIECKSATTVGPDDTKGLQAFAVANPENFVRGIVAYCGPRTIDLTPAQFPPRSLLAIPITKLLL
jgi:predicted AAA+ superfamily ATPase